MKNVWKPPRKNDKDTSHLAKWNILYFTSMFFWNSRGKFPWNLTSLFFGEVVVSWNFPPESTILGQPKNIFNAKRLKVVSSSSSLMALNLSWPSLRGCFFSEGRGRCRKTASFLPPNKERSRTEILCLEDDEPFKSPIFLEEKVGD